MLDRRFKLATALVGAAIAYVVLCLVLFAPIAISECIPRSDPLIHLCDVEKQREVTIYLGVFLVNPVIAAFFARRRGACASLIYLIASALLPFIATTAYGLTLGNWRA